MCGESQYFVRLIACQIFLLLGDTSAAKRTLKKAYKMHLGINDAEQGRLADLLKNGQTSTPFSAQTAYSVLSW